MVLYKCSRAKLSVQGQDIECSYEAGGKENELTRYPHN